MRPEVFSAPRSVAASTRSTYMTPAARRSMSLPPAKLRTSRRYRSPPAAMSIRPSRALASSTTRPVASLMRMAPCTVERTLSVSTSVLSWASPAVCTSRRSEMNTEAPSLVTACAVRLSTPPVVAAATMPLCTASVPSTISVTLRAGSKPCSPPTKPLSVRSSCTWTKMSCRARRSKRSAGSWSTCRLMKPVSCAGALTEVLPLALTSTDCCTAVAPSARTITCSMASSAALPS